MWFRVAPTAECPTSRPLSLLTVFIFGLAINMINLFLCYFVLSGSVFRWRFMLEVHEVFAGGLLSARFEIKIAFDNHKNESLLLFHFYRQLKEISLTIKLVLWGLHSKVVDLMEFEPNRRIKQSAISYSTLFISHRLNRFFIRLLVTKLKHFRKSLIYFFADCGIPRPPARLGKSRKFEPPPAPSPTPMPPSLAKLGKPPQPPPPGFLAAKI